MADRSRHRRAALRDPTERRDHRERFWPIAAHSWARRVLSSSTEPDGVRYADTIFGAVSVTCDLRHASVCAQTASDPSSVLGFPSSRLSGEAVLIGEGRLWRIPGRHREGETPSVQAVESLDRRNVLDGLLFYCIIE